MKFHLGTANQYKVQELAAILRPLEIDLEVTPPFDPEETETTFKGNAQLKASEYGKQQGQCLVNALIATQHCSKEEAYNFLKLSQNYVISEDSGISISNMGIPGPWSARFSDCTIEHGKVVAHTPSNRSREVIDHANNQKVLDLLKGVEQPHRAATMEIALAVADMTGKVVFTCSSTVPGWILESEQGINGFGYDPIFASQNSFGKSWAEIDRMRKNLISHRRQVLAQFTHWLAKLLKS